MDAEAAGGTGISPKQVHFNLGEERGNVDKQPHLKGQSQQPATERNMFLDTSAEQEPEGAGAQDLLQHQSENVQMSERDRPEKQEQGGATALRATLSPPKDSPRELNAPQEQDQRRPSTPTALFSAQTPIQPTSRQSFRVGAGGGAAAQDLQVGRDSAASMDLLQRQRALDETQQALERWSRQLQAQSEQARELRVPQPLTEMQWANRVTEEEVLECLSSGEVSERAEQILRKYVAITRVNKAMGKDPQKEPPNSTLPAPQASPEVQFLRHVSPQQQHQVPELDRSVTSPSSYKKNQEQEHEREGIASSPSRIQIKQSPTSHQADRASRSHASSASGGAADTHATSSKVKASSSSTRSRKTNDKVKAAKGNLVSALTRCPNCGKKNEKIKGEPLQHYMFCKKGRTDFVLTTDELVAKTQLEGIRRRIHGVTDRSEATQKVEKDEKTARKAGERTLHSDSSRSSSSEPDVERNKDGYEDDPGSSDESVSSSSSAKSESSSSTSSSSTSTVDEPTPPQRKKKQALSTAASRARQSATSNSTSSGASSAPVSANESAIQSKFEAFEHRTNDLAATMREVFAVVKDLRTQVQLLSQPSATTSLGQGTRLSTDRNTDLNTQLTSARPSASREMYTPPQPSWIGGSASLESVHSFLRQEGGGAAARDFRGAGGAAAPDFRGTLHGLGHLGQQHYPEIEEKELGNMSGFEKHKKTYKEYVSKCADRQRRPVTLAQTFEKWVEWIAVVFTEQDRQRAEAEGQASHHLYLKAEVLEMSDLEFEQRYTEMCGLSMQEPSTVLDFLREVEVDVSNGDIQSILVAAESFRGKLKRVPARALFATTADRVRNAFVESLFGEDKGKRKRVDYDHLDTWERVTELLVRTASRSSTGKAFESFKPVIGKKKDKDKKDSDKDKDKTDSAADEDKELCQGVDMRVTSEKKWFARFKYLARKEKIGLDKHGGSKSWKTRYAYLMDSIDEKSGRCSRCKARGHRSSACEDPLPEVLYPTLAASEEPGRSESRPRDSRDERKDDRRSGGDYRQREYSRERGGYRDDRRRESSRDRWDSRSDRRDDWKDRREERRDDRRDSSLTRDAARDDRQDRPREQSRGRDDRPREGSRERSERSPARRGECYRCGRDGHMSRECKADTHVDGRPINSSERSPSRGDQQRPGSRA